MRGYAVRSEERLIGEAAEFSNGEVVVQWANHGIGRFPSLSMLRGAIQGSVTIESIRPEPMSVRLRRAREGAGLSQRGLSRQIGVSFSTISRIEAGNNYVSNQAIEDWLDSTQ